MIIISCVIVSSCSQEVMPFLEKCIKSIKKSSKLAKLSLKIVLVSDAPTTKTTSIRAVDDFINAGNKLGFGSMNNYAIDFVLKKYSSDYILLINDDAWVKHDFFKIVKKSIKERHFDIFYPAIYKPNKKILDSYGIEYFKSGYASPIKLLNLKPSMFAGTCVLINKKLIQKLKRRFGFVFNPLFYFYHEDVELGIRVLSLQATIINSKNLVAYHIGNTTSKNNKFLLSYLPIRNLLWVILLTWPLRTIFKYFGYIVTVYGWLVWSEFKYFIPFIYIIVFVNTIIKSKDLISYRLKTIPNYDKGFMFESIFSPHMFRTRKKNIAIG